jgi:hypothetical protein
MSLPATALVRDDATVTTGSFLGDNVSALCLAGETARAVLSATARGRVVHTSDRTPVLELNGLLLGAPPADEELLSTVRRSHEKAVFVVYGLGMGHVPRALRSLGARSVVVFEPDIGLLRTVLEHGPADLGAFPIVTSLQDLTQIWLEVGGNHTEAVVVRTAGYAEAYPAALLELPGAIRDLFQRVGITRNTYDVRARVWVDDILENLETIIGTVPFLALGGKYRNVPAFIVGAGPSLDRNVALLEEATKKGIVFAVNSSARALAKQGVVPQVLACIESMDSSALLAELPFIDEVVRAFSMSAAPSILRTGRGPLLPMHEILPQFMGAMDELLGVPGVAVCGSVSTAVFSLAHALGCSPIVLLGQDLAYTSGRTHAGGTWWDESRATVSKETGEMKLEWSDALKKVGHRHSAEPLTEIPAWGGEGTVASGASFTGMRGWFEIAATILKARSGSLRLVNATEGGASVAGFEELRLRDVLDGLPELGITAESIALAAVAARAPLGRAHVVTWARRQAERAGRVRRAARHLRRAGVHAAGAIRGENARATDQAFVALSEAEGALRLAVHAAPLVDLWAHAAVRGATADSDDGAGAGARAEAEEATQRGIRVATAIERSAQELAGKIAKIARRLDDGRTTVHMEGNSSCR